MNKNFRVNSIFALVLYCISLACVGTSGAMENDARDSFPFRDGDRVVFLGDSITQQGIYTTYLETYLLTRFPNWKLQFRNAGWDSDTAYFRSRELPPGEALQRDVLALQPTVVMVNFGMNDAGYIGGPFDQSFYDKHVTGLTAIVRQLKAADIRPILLTPNAIEQKESGEAMQGYNLLLEQFSAAGFELAGRENIPFVNQLHPYAAAINRLRAVGSELRITDEVVHPSPPGQLMMADFILTGLNAPNLVSSATIDANQAVRVSAEGAQITDIVRKPDGISFRRLDQALVFPLESAARPALALVPVADDINRYMLRVVGLEVGAYTVAVNGQEISRFSAAQLNEGVNLGFYESPLMTAGSETMKRVRHKNDLYFTRWREVQLGNLPAAQKQEQLSNLDRRIAAEEQAIDALRKPATFQFDIKRTVMPAARPATPRP